MSGSAYEQSRTFKLFQQHRFHEALKACDTEIRQADEATCQSLKYLRSLCLTRLGRLDEAQSILCEIPGHPRASDRLKRISLLRIGLHSLRNQDFELSADCNRRYRELCGDDATLAECWSGCLELLEGHSDSWEHVLQQFFLAPEQENIQGYLGFTICHTEELDAVEKVLPFFSDRKRLHSGLLKTAIIEYYLSHGDLSAAREWLALKLPMEINSPTSDVHHRYFELRIAELANMDAEALDKKARSLLEDIARIQDCVPREIQLYCQGLARQVRNQWTPLVPSRYGIVGNSPGIRMLREKIERFAPTELGVLIVGESGTGKELVARALHAASPRRRQRFLAINCAMLGGELAESRLFGHVKGSFTGAVGDHSGLLHHARRGTLFLDEIGELPLSAQAKLFRFLDTGSFRRLGSGRDEPADVRILAASNQDLGDASLFRHELYYRLSQVTLRLPALSERGEDILHIARRVLREMNSRFACCKELGPGCEELLLEYHWPGNVRELRQTIERAWHESPYIIRPQHIHFEPHEERPAEGSEWSPDLEQEGLDLERETQLFSARLVQRMLERTGRDTAEAARRLRISERTVYRWMARAQELGMGKTREA